MPPSKPSHPTPSRVDPLRDITRPPESIDALRSLAVSVGRDGSPVSLGAKAHSLLARLLERPEGVALCTITELAESLGVSASTLTRLATRLGYGGFVEFQAVFRAGLIGPRTGHFYSSQAGRLVASSARGHNREVGTHPSAELGMMLQIANDSIGNIEGFLSQLSADELKQAVQLLGKAPRVRVHGIRQFSAVASFLCYGLSMVRGDVGALDPHGLGVAEGLAQLQAGDVLVVASVEPYTRSVAEATSAAAKAGLHVIALTDHRASPLAAFAKHAFFIPHRSALFSNSMGAYIIFCEGLLNLVATRLGKKALSALERRERFIEELGIE